MKVFHKKEGFTLIELLVVIAIIAVLVAFSVTNFLGARQRAKDVKIKSELAELKNALRLYYNDYSIYPATAASPNDINGCGNAVPSPNESCASTCPTGAGAATYQFAAGGANPGCTNVYMKLLPPATDYPWEYAQAGATLGDDFCLWAALNNSSDPEVARSQAKCNPVCGSLGIPSNTYVLCAD